MRILVASGVPGAGSARRRAAALRQARRAALLVAFRARLRAAHEALGCLVGLPLRADPVAVVAIAPWELLWRLLRVGAAPWAQAAEGLQEPTRTTGPLVAASAGLRNAGLSFDSDRVGAADVEALDPFAVSLPQLRRFLQDALRRRWWQG